MSRSLRPGRGQNKYIHDVPDAEEAPSKRAKVEEEPVDEDAEPTNGQTNEETSDQPEDPLGDLHDKVRQSVAVALKEIVQTLVERATAQNEHPEWLPKDETADLYAAKLAVRLEAALFDNFANKPRSSSRNARPVDVGQRYREKFRTLNFNLRDDKNAAFQQHVISQEISPAECATLTPEQMMSPELQKLRDEVIKESIRESVLKVDEPARVRRTHKDGENDEHDDQHPEEDLEEDLEETGGPIPEVGVPGSIMPDQMLADEREGSNSKRVNDPGSYYRTDYAAFDSPQASDDDMAVGKEEVLKADDNSNEMVPVWEGKLTLQQNHGEFLGAGLRLSGPKNQEAWGAILDPVGPLQIASRSTIADVGEYLTNVADRSTLGAIAIISDDSEGSFRVWDFLATRKSAGILELPSSGIVKTAYIVPWGTADATSSLEGLTLGTGATALLEKLQEDHKVLVGVLVLPPRL